MVTPLVTPPPSIPFQFSTTHMKGQRRFCESTAEWLMYSGSFGAGKSRVGTEKGLYLSLKYPNNFGAILRRTFASLRHTTMRTFFQYVCPESYLAKPYNKEEHKLTLKNGSEIIFIGLDSDIKIGSLELGWAFVDEAIEVPEDVWIMLDGRVGRIPHVPFSQLMAATNPASTSHYLYKYFFEDNDPAREVIEANSLENPYLTEEYRNKLQKYTGRYKERYVLGHWAGFEGLVYDHVDVNDVVISPFKLPEDCTWYRAIDFGYSNPFVCQWWVELPAKYDFDPVVDRELLVEDCICSDVETTIPYSLPHYTRCLGNPIKGFYLVYEIYMTHRLVERHAVDMLRVTDQWGIKPITLETMADHDAQGRAVLNDYGIITTAAKKRIGNGIQTVTKLFDEGLIHIFEDALLEVDEGLVEARNPKCTLEELGNYKWRVVRVISNQKEEPQDKDNHGMDAMRYLFHTLLGEDANYGDTIYEVTSESQGRGLSAATEPAIYTNRDWGALLPSSRDWRSMG